MRGLVSKALTDLKLHHQDNKKQVKARIAEFTRRKTGRQSNFLPLLPEEHRAPRAPVTEETYIQHAPEMFVAPPSAPEGFCGPRQFPLSRFGRRDLLSFWP